jgi:hypothetical protein
MPRRWRRSITPAFKAQVFLELLVMNLTEQYPSRRVGQLLGFPRSLLYRTPAEAADLRAALLRLFADE